MQVKVNIHVSGLRDGQPWPPIGGVLEMSQDEALPLLQNGTVIPVYDPESGVEARVVEPTQDVVVESDGTVDTSARDALVASSTKRTRQRNR